MGNPIQRVNSANSAPRSNTAPANSTLVANGKPDTTISSARKVARQSQEGSVERKKQGYGVITKAPRLLVKALRNKFRSNQSKVEHERPVEHIASRSAANKEPDSAPHTDHQSHEVAVPSTATDVCEAGIAPVDSGSEDEDALNAADEYADARNAAYEYFDAFEEVEDNRSYAREVAIKARATRS